MRWNLRLQRHARTPYRGRALVFSVLSSRYARLASAGFTNRRYDAWGLHRTVFFKRALYRCVLNVPRFRVPSLATSLIRLGFVASRRLLQSFPFLFSGLLRRAAVIVFGAVLPSLGGLRLARLRCWSALFRARLCGRILRARRPARRPLLPLLPPSNPYRP
jgi:hypothetical protein